LVLPVEAPDPALHAFLADALERLPNLTLDDKKAPAKPAGALA